MQWNEINSPISKVRHRWITRILLELKKNWKSWQRKNESLNFSNISSNKFLFVLLLNRVYFTNGWCNDAEKTYFRETSCWKNDKKWTWNHWTETFILSDYTHVHPFRHKNSKNFNSIPSLTNQNEQINSGKKIPKYFYHIAETVIGMQIEDECLHCFVVSTNLCILKQFVQF